MEISVELDEYTFHCEITSYTYQKPLGKWADSDWDCYGYEEMEFECHSVTVTDEDGFCSHVENKAAIESILNKEYARGDSYGEAVYDKILDEIHERQADVDYD